MRLGLHQSTSELKFLTFHVDFSDRAPFSAEYNHLNFKTISKQSSDNPFKQEFVSFNRPDTPELTTNGYLHLLQGLENIITKSDQHVDVYDDEIPSPNQKSCIIE